jgi:hypothetical protein
MIYNKEPDHHQLYLWTDKPHYIKFHYLHFHMPKVLFQALPAYHVPSATASLNHPTILISPCASLFQFHCDSYQISACIIIIFARSDFCFFISEKLLQLSK